MRRSAFSSGNAADGTWDIRLPLKDHERPRFRRRMTKVTKDLQQISANQITDVIVPALLLPLIRCHWSPSLYLYLYLYMLCPQPVANQHERLSSLQRTITVNEKKQILASTSHIMSQGLSQCTQQFCSWCSCHWHRRSKALLVKGTGNGAVHAWSIAAFAGLLGLDTWSQNQVYLSLQQVKVMSAIMKPCSAKVPKFISGHDLTIHCIWSNSDHNEMTCDVSSSSLQSLKIGN